MKITYEFTPASASDTGRALLVARCGQHTRSMDLPANIGPLHVEYSRAKDRLAEQLGNALNGPDLHVEAS